MMPKKELRMLNVEDSERDYELLKRHLVSSGYELVAERVGTAEAMRDALKKHEWDIVFCDYSMSRFEPMSALTLLNEIQPDVPLIIISGAVGEAVAVEAMRMGAQDYLLKDDLTRLIPTIERELQEAENRREKKRTETERRVICDVLQGLITTPNLDAFLKLIHRSIGEIVYAENCFVALHDDRTDMFHFEFWVDKHDPVSSPRPVGKGFTTYVLRSGQPLLLTAETKRRMFDRGDVQQLGSSAAAWLGVPLRTPARIIGVLVLQNYEDEDAFSKRDLELLSSIGDQIALAIERKRAITALRESEERYRSVVETASDAIITIDQHGTIHFVNRASERIFGYSLDEMRGAALTMLMPAYKRRVHTAGTDRYVPNGTKETPWESIEPCGLTKDGVEIALEVSFSEHEQNGHRYFTGIISDITERKRAEEARRNAEERYRGIFENAVEGIFQSTPDGRFIAVNTAMAAILGFDSPAQLLALRTDIATQHYVDPNSRLAIMETLTREDVVVGRECEVYRSDLSKIWTRENIRAIRDKWGTLLHYEGSIEDITERKALEEQLRQSQKMEAVGALAGGIAHDFNNLLTAISGYSDLTLRQMQPDDHLRRNIQEIKKACGRASDLTGQLLAFSRKQVLKPTVHNLNYVVTDLERMLRRLIKESIEFRTILAPDLNNIRADQGQVQQVIMNLAVNARDAMPRGGVLTIQTCNVETKEWPEGGDLTADRQAGFIKLTITDTGDGMDEKTRRRIFEPFFTTKDVGKGTGLGLSTVHGIVKQSGGDIRVFSELGCGSRFEIYLPSVTQTLSNPRPAEITKETYAGTETVLLVEDEDIVRNLVREIMTINGYKVLEAESGSVALSICGSYSQPIHLLLTDIVMSKMSGTQLKEKVTTLRPDIKTLFMSGYTDDYLGRNGVFDSRTAFIEKPFTPESLSQKIREVLEYDACAPTENRSLSRTLTTNRTISQVRLQTTT